jgi:hypothetical protein
LVLKVDPKLYQDKSLLKHREVIGSWTQGVLLHWYEGWDTFTYVKQSKNKAKVYPPNKIKWKNSKRSTTLEVLRPQVFFIGVKRMEVLVLLLPHVRQRAFLVWDGQIGPVILRWVGLHWLYVGRILLHIMSHLLMSTIWDVIPYQHLSHDSWPWGFQITPHLVPINIYLFTVDFCQGFGYWGNWVITK